MMQLTSQNRFTRSLSGGYKMANGSCVRKLFFKNGSECKLRVRSRCHGCEVESSESTETGSR